MISHWFVPDDKQAIRPDRISRNALWHQVRFIQDHDQPCAAGDLMLISFDRLMSQRIKRHLYQFSSTPSQAMTIMDCGHYSQRQADTIVPLLQELRQSGAMTLLLGAPYGLMRHQTDGARMASIIRESNLDDDVHLRNDQSQTLFQYLGTQRHLVSETYMKVEGHLRLSDLREELSLAEPCIRDSDTLLFNCDSMSAAEAGYMTGMSGSGLSVIEACQLFRYAGAAQSLSSAGIYGYSMETDHSGMMANALAQMIWYLLEGSTLREDPEKSSLTQYHVQSKDHEHAFLFFKSEISGRWWIEDRSGRKVACSYRDYKKACEEDYSEIVIKSVMG